MVERQISCKADLGLRIVGLALCGAAIAVVARLYSNLHDGTGRALGTFDWGLATVAYPMGVAGAALTFSGRHLFDRVPVGPRNLAIARHRLQPLSKDL